MDSTQKSFKSFYRNRLPHLAPVGGCFFVTFRLSNSLPNAVYNKIVAEYTKALKAPQTSEDSVANDILIKTYNKYFHQIDSLLDQETKGLLQKEEIAKIISDRLDLFDGKYYNLIAYSIMPNHVHVLLDFGLQVINEDGLVANEKPNHYVQLDQVMRLIKGDTSFMINKKLNRSGQLWAKDSYDRLVRDLKEREHVIRYILDNPVKARLVNGWKEWPYTYLKQDH